MTEMKKSGIVGIGSALMDILVREDDEFLRKEGIVKGGMTYVDNEFIDQVVSRAKGKPHIVPGGSACNTIIGIGNLGGNARFVGKMGKDNFAMLFETDLKAQAIDPILFSSASPTGRVLSVITPDAQRSMLTFLGASSEMSMDEITPDCFQDAGIVHIEGYLLFDRELMTAILKAAKSAGAQVCLDLASFTVVEASGDFLESLVRDYVDILIANEDEARVFTGHEDEYRALRALSEKADMAVLKLGKRGSLISRSGHVVEIAPQGIGADVTDTTGAGDLWASGFLFGLVSGYPLEKCGSLASMCGYEVCRVVGANIPREAWAGIRKSAGIQQ